MDSNGLEAILPNDKKPVRPPGGVFIVIEPGATIVIPPRENSTVVIVGPPGGPGEYKQIPPEGGTIVVPPNGWILYPKDPVLFIPHDDDDKPLPVENPANGPGRKFNPGINEIGIKPPPKDPPNIGNPSDPEFIGPPQFKPPNPYPAIDPPIRELPPMKDVPDSGPKKELPKNYYELEDQNRHKKTKN